MVNAAENVPSDCTVATLVTPLSVTVTVVVSLATQPKSDAELAGLVYGLTEVPSVGDVPFYKKPLFWAAVVIALFIALNIIFW